MKNIRHNGNITMEDIYNAARVIRPKSLAQNFSGIHPDDNADDDDDGMMKKLCVMMAVLNLCIWISHTKYTRNKYKLKVMKTFQAPLGRFLAQPSLLAALLMEKTLMISSSRFRWFVLFKEIRQKLQWSLILLMMMVESRKDDNKLTTGWRLWVPRRVRFSQESVQRDPTRRDSYCPRMGSGLK